MVDKKLSTLNWQYIKLGYVVRMVIESILPRAKSGPSFIQGAELWKFVKNFQPIP